MCDGGERKKYLKKYFLLLRSVKDKHLMFRGTMKKIKILQIACCLDRWWHAIRNNLLLQEFNINRMKKYVNTSYILRIPWDFQSSKLTLINRWKEVTYLRSENATLLIFWIPCFCF